MCSDVRELKAFPKAGSIIKLLKKMSYPLLCKSNCHFSTFLLNGKCKDPGNRCALAGPEPWGYRLGDYGQGHQSVDLTHTSSLGSDGVRDLPLKRPVIP